MDALILHVMAWPTLGSAVLVWGFAPGALLRLTVRLYPRDHPRRREMLGELCGVPRIERPFWVAEQLEAALSEGLGGRLAAWRARRMVPAFIHVRLPGGEWTLELRVTAELKRAGLPLEQFVEAYDLALQNGSLRRVRTVPGIQPGTAWFTTAVVPRQGAARTGRRLTGPGCPTGRTRRPAWLGEDDRAGRGEDDHLGADPGHRDDAPRCQPEQHGHRQQGQPERADGNETQCLVPGRRPGHDVP